MQHYRGIRMSPDVEPQLAKKNKNIKYCQSVGRLLRVLRRFSLLQGSAARVTTSCSCLPTLRNGEKNNYFFARVTKRTPEFLDSVALCTSSRPPTREREFRGRFLNTRTHQRRMFWNPVILWSEQTRLAYPKFKVSETFLIGAF